MAQPLAGIRVFELGSNVAGPYGAWILAELGAEVIKVERPEGDDARQWGPPFYQGQATLFHAINRNKKSAVRDLKQAEVAAKLRRDIVDGADVVLQNMRSGAAAKLGLGAEQLCRDKPDLIYCNLHAFGAKGPLKSRPGYDALMQAFGGVMSVTGAEGQPPVRCGISVIDMGTGMWCAIGILAALARRAATGKGGIVDASLLETALAWNTFYAADYQVTGTVPKRFGTGVRGIAPYQAYECADGYLIVAASNDRLFVKLADALGHPEWRTDPRFADNPSRSDHREALNAMIDGLLIEHPRAHWRDLLDTAGIPNAPIQSIDEVLAHPQVQAIGMAQPLADDLQLFGLPLSFDGERPPLRNGAPDLGDEN